MSPQIQQETLARKSVGFSIRLIRFLRGQDKRSAVGRSGMVGILRVLERRFRKGCGGSLEYAYNFNTIEDGA